MLRRAVVPLLIESLIPIVVIGLIPLGFLVADRGRFESGRLQVEMAVGFAVLGALSLVWVGRECVRLTPTGITIVRRIGSTSIPWWQVRGIEVKRSFGQRFVHLAGPEGDAQVFAPNSGVLFFKDREFEAKVATIEAWWTAHRQDAPPLNRPAAR